MAQDRLPHDSRSFTEEKPLIGTRERRGRSAKALFDLRNDINWAFVNTEIDA